MTRITKSMIALSALMSVGLVAAVGADVAARRLHVAPTQLSGLIGGSHLVFDADPTIRARLAGVMRGANQHATAAR